MDPNNSRNDAGTRLTDQARIEVLLEEYRALNALLLFRLSAMDRRLPLSAGFVAAAIAAILSLPSGAQVAVLVVTPAAILWLVRTTGQHGRAKEDHLRRIDEIERAVNAIAGERLLVFQSHHPNRGSFTAGRTGSTTLLATATGAAAMLCLCVFLFLDTTRAIPVWFYIVYVGLIGVDIGIQAWKLSRYRYRRPIETEPNHTYRV